MNLVAAVDKFVKTSLLCRNLTWQLLVLFLWVRGLEN